MPSANSIPDRRTALPASSGKVQVIRGAGSSDVTGPEVEANRTNEYTIAEGSTTGLSAYLSSESDIRLGKPTTS